MYKKRTQVKFVSNEYETMLLDNNNIKTLWCLVINSAHCIGTSYEYISTWIYNCLQFVWKKLHNVERGGGQFHVRLYYNYIIVHKVYYKYNQIMENIWPSCFYNLFNTIYFLGQTYIYCDQLRKKIINWTQYISWIHFYIVSTLCLTETILK